MSCAQEMNPMLKKFAGGLVASLAVVWALSLFPDAVASEAQNDFVNIVGKDVGIDVRQFAGPPACRTARLPGTVSSRKAIRFTSTSPCGPISSASTPSRIAPRAPANPWKTFPASPKHEEGSNHGTNPRPAAVSTVFLNESSIRREGFHVRCATRSTFELPRFLYIFSLCG